MNDALTRAWFALIVLGLATTALATLIETGGAGPWIGTAILAIAWFKMHLILSRYLGLANAPFWRRGFDFVLALFVILLLGLYLASAL